MKKVLYISHDGSNKGGASLALLDLIIDAKEKGVEPVLLIPKDEGIRELFSGMDIQIIEFYYGWWVFENSDNKFKYILLFLKTIFKEIISLLNLFINIRKFKGIDIIHTNSSVVGVGCYLAMITKKKHVFHVREFGEEHHNYRFIFGTEKTRRFIGEFSDRVVVISKALKKKYLKYIDKNKIALVYDGVSEKYLNKKNSDFINTQNMNILVAGSIQRGKGQLEVIKAINLIQNDKIILNIAGNCGDDNYLNEIKNYINENKLDNRVKLLGVINDMNSLRKNIDVEIINSYMEGFGRVAVEAMLSEIPLIVARSGANTELVKENINGLIYEYGDIKKLAKCIEYLYSMKDERVRLGKAGFKIASEKYMQKYNTEQLLNLYLEV